MRMTCGSDATLPGTVLARLEGHLDPDGAEQMRTQLGAQIGPDAPRLLLDVGGVDWMSSSGVGALMFLLSRVQMHQGALALFGCVPRVRSVLRVCGLETVLQVCDDEAAARERLRITLPG